MPLDPRRPIESLRYRGRDVGIVMLSDDRVAIYYESTTESNVFTVHVADESLVPVYADDEQYTTDPIPG